MAQTQKNIAAVVYDLLQPCVVQMGYELWDVEYVKEGSRYYLRITLDSQEGIGIEDCELVHRTIDPILDEADPISNSYTLEVSSPGIERVLRTPEHFQKMCGETILVKLFRPLQNQKQLKGTLCAFDQAQNAISLQVTGQSECFIIPLSDISRANVAFEF
jgi:ribosome maturation factor RimP